MQVFELVKSVLDENYAKIAGVPTERDDRICQRITELQEAYSALASENEITYNEPSIRFAYIYKYVTSHVNIVYQKICSNMTLRSLFQLPQVTVSCIGGGPGSDLVGILKFVSGKDDAKPKLRCFILDGENSWADAWSDVDEKLDSNFNISTYFIPMDVTDNSAWSQQSKYLNADLFTMIYFASEIFSKREQAKPFFEHLFANMKPGGLLLYIDNNARCFTEWFDALVKAAGLEVLEAEEENVKMTIDEEKTELGEYLAKFSAVKLEANVAIRICRKPNQS